MRFATFAAGAALAAASIALPFQAPASAQADAKVRVAHFSPDAPAVDVYVDGKKKLSNVPYQAMSDYLALPAGSHTFEVRAAGTPATGVPAIKAAPDLAAGKSYTVAAVGKLATITGQVYEDDVTPPAAGKAKVRVIHAAADVPEVDVAVKGGAVLFPKVAFNAATPYTELAAGSYDLEIRAAGTTNVLLGRPVTVQPGGIYTIAAVGGGDKPASLRGFVDVAPNATAAPDTAVAGATSTTAAAGTATTAVTPTAAATATTTKAAAATTTAAAKSAVTKPAATKVSATKVADTKATDTKVTDTKATETTVADTAASDSSVADTAVADTTADTAADTAASDSTSATPTGAVSTGVGGPHGGLLVPIAALLMLTAGAVGTGVLRRRPRR